MQEDQKGCKKNIRAEEEQINAARTKQHEDEEEDTGIRPKNKKKVYKNSTAVPVQHAYSRKKMSTKAETGGFELTLCLSRIERSTAKPKGKVVITCRLREGNFEKSFLAEFGCDTRSFAEDRGGCCCVG